jgi:molybdopterin synthase catalytic subunit
MEIRVSPAPFDPQAEEAAFAFGRKDIGAVVSFTGICRDRNGGQDVGELFLDHYPGFTEREIGRIAAGVAERCRCPDLKVIHRVGRILPGEPIVLVTALSEHREQAFEAVRLLMDYLKTDAPLWKCETGAGGVRWVEPRAEDIARRAKAEASSCLASSRDDG